LTTAIHRRVDALRAGRDPGFVARLASGWAVMGERQVLPGYCLLLPDPVVPDLNALARDERTQFLVDMAALGDAVQRVTRALRINYAIFGNLEPALHAHVIPRYQDESAPYATTHPWAYDWNAAVAYDPEQHRELRDRIHAALGAAT
jgi:diadenosine tetraphosphate (Ap4A) HIT family hydrolase